MTVNIPENVTQYRERVISKTVKYFTGTSLLDSGCGDGEDVYLKKKYFKKITGVDIAESPRWEELSGRGITRRNFPLKTRHLTRCLKKICYIMPQIPSAPFRK